jgi:hypothetical protein
MVYAVEMASFGMICIPNFMKIVYGVQAVLKFFLSNLNLCDVDVTDGKEL